MRRSSPVCDAPSRAAALTLVVCGVWACDSQQSTDDVARSDADTAEVADDAEVDASDVGPDVEVTPHPALEGTEPATFRVRPGVEIVTVFDATPGTPVTLYDREGRRLL